MTTKNHFDERISRWLEAEAPRQVPDRVLYATFERTHKSRQHGTWRTLLGRLHGNRMTVQLAGVATLAIVVLVALGIYFNQPGLFGGTPTVSPSPTPSPVDSSLPVGAYELDPGRVHGEDRVTVTIPAPGWFAGPFAASISKDLGGDDRVTIVAVGGDHYKVPRDICGWQTSPDDDGDRIADTLDDLAAFLMEQTYDTSTGSLTREFAPPEAITLDGHPGQLIRSVVPLDPNSDRGDCDRDPSEGQFSQQRLLCSLQDRDGFECLLAHLQPGALDTVWLVDADQPWFRVIAASFSPTTSAELLAETHSIVESITFAE